MSQAPTDLPVVCSWSGGKDSCFALLEARRLGYRPVALINMLDGDGRRTRAHGLNPALLQAQADALGLPLLQGKAAWGEYEAELLRLLALSQERYGAQGVVFGDIDLEAHKAWEERVTAKVAMQTILPLWQQDRRALVDRMLREGVKTLVTACRAPLDPDLLGQTLTPALLDRIEADGACSCGEDGEYHSTVYDCAAFSAPLCLKAGEVVERDRYWQIELELAPTAEHTASRARKVG